MPNIEKIWKYIRFGLSNMENSRFVLPNIYNSRFINSVNLASQILKIRDFACQILKIWKNSRFGLANVENAKLCLLNIESSIFGNKRFIENSRFGLPTFQIQGLESKAFKI